MTGIIPEKKVMNFPKRFVAQERGEGQCYPAPGPTLDEFFRSRFCDNNGSRQYGQIDIAWTY